MSMLESITTQFTLGGSKTETEWRRRVPIEELLPRLTRSPEGEKDGTCYTPATFRGIRRNKNDTDQIGMAILDSDCGHSMREIIAAINAAGYEAFIHSTHSHLITQTAIKKRDLEKSNSNVLAHMRKKGFLPHIIQHGYIAGATEDGEHYTVGHAPCPKYRIMIPLAQPWHADTYESQNAANLEWHNFTCALAASLGLSTDQSCCDTSRLFYFPRTRRYGPPFECRHVEGRPCDMREVLANTPRNNETRPNESFTAHVELLPWASEFGPVFELVTALRTRKPEIIVRPNGAKTAIQCPFEAEHTNPGGEGCFAVNASDLPNAGLPSIKSGFYIKCMHNACIDRDRLDYIAEMLTQGWLSNEDLTASEFLIGYSSDNKTKTGSNTANEWPEPKPLPEGLSPVSPFNAKFLPATISPWVMDIANRMQCPPDFVGVSAMTALGSVIGCRVTVRPKLNDDWCEAPNLWGLVVGVSGVMKSPAMRAALAPLRQLEKNAAGQNEYGKKAHDAAMALYKVRMEVVTKEAKKNITSATAESFMIDAPKEFCEKRYIVNDPTYERLGEILHDNPNGVLVFRDEVIKLLKFLNREEQVTAKGMYLQAANGIGEYRFDRVMRRLKTDVPELCLSLLGATTPGPLAGYMRDALTRGEGDDGMIQRMGLLVYPELSTNWEDIDKLPAKGPKDAAWRTFDHLNQLTPEKIGAITDEYSPYPYIRLDPGAQDVFKEWRKDHERLLRSGELVPALNSHFSKYRKLVASLALINHLSDLGTGPISEVAMRRSLAMVEYLETHAKRAYTSSVSVAAAAAKSILQKILRGDLPNEFTARDIYRHQWTDLSDREHVENALTLLDDFDWLRTERRKSGGLGGRPSMVYLVNPRGRT